MNREQHIKSYDKVLTNQGYVKMNDSNGVDKWVGRVDKANYSKNAILDKPKDIIQKTVRTVDKIVYHLTS